MQELLDKAIQLATKAHAEQTDKVGEPYILHPLRVMFSFKPYQVNERIVAVLHDVIEDTTVGHKELCQTGFTTTQVDALDLLFHRKGQPYSAYIENLCGGNSPANDIAKKVKRADILDNTSLERLIRLPQSEIDRLQHKYATGLRILESYL